MQGVAAAQATQSHPHAAQHAEALHCLTHVVRTARVETAMLAQHGADPALVKPEQGKDKALHAIIEGCSGKAQSGCR
jgi:hypothetical protein